MNEIYAGLLGVVLVVGGFLYYNYGPELEQLTVGAVSTFKSVQLAASPSNGDCLTTNGTDNAWGNCGGVGSIDGTGVANTIAVWSDADTLTATSGNPLYATRFTATSTTASSTLPRIVVSTALDFFGTFANSLDDLCVAITGGAGLCDGNDASGGGGSGTVSTSTGETGDHVAFWTTTGGTPALLGSDAGLSYSSTTDRLTTVNASTSRLTVVTEAKFGGSATSTFSSAGVLTLASNLFMPASSKIDFGGGDVTITDGGANNLTIDGGTLNVTNGDIVVGTNGRVIDLQSSGIRFASDNDGALTLSGLGNGTNHTLTWNLDDNTHPTVSSSAAAINWGSLNLYTTGKIGIASTTPNHSLSIGTTGSSYGSVAVTENPLATSTAMTINWANGNQQLVRLGASATTIGFNNASTSGMTLKLVVCNPGSTGPAVTWSISTLLWSQGVEPTRTTTANKCDIFSFVVTQATSTSAGSQTILGAATTNF
jgi:hypothetical protein